ncbi:hypothetical protein HUG10_21155 (plasmid) [Halorarum halophilum]|uniref:Uncharacterized protein n=1 Tax=Halorarum halophilum TaxID=2743090 RepID=A0A7D5KGU4_9EURY|nr:hypothetical protein [Halobaculum halophilum]QLG30097.1 hypothetical protein HUG10_21155 [Halobaculum halophilum]
MGQKSHPAECGSSSSGNLAAPVKVNVGLWKWDADLEKRIALESVKCHLTDISPDGEFGLVEVAEDADFFDEWRVGEIKEIEMGQLHW